MSERTNIAWCDSTFNPWIGCTKVGPGCDHCYAETQDSRKRWGGTTHWGPGVARYRTAASNWAQPLKWNKAAAASGKVHRVFCASLADVFDNEVPQEWRDDLWELICKTPHLEWLLVTKRIGNVEKMGGAMLLKTVPNTRLLTTVCNQEEADRDIPKLLALPCKNGISYEPALGPVDFHRNSAGGIYHTHHGIEWIIVGGESGPKARPFDVAWAHSTIEQCRAASVSCFVKQIGSNAQYHGSQGLFRYQFKHRAGADSAEWPQDLRVREFPA